MIRVVSTGLLGLIQTQTRGLVSLIIDITDVCVCELALRPQGMGCLIREAKVKPNGKSHSVTFWLTTLGDGPLMANSENLLCSEWSPSLSCLVALLAWSFAVAASLNKNK